MNMFIFRFNRKKFMKLFLRLLNYIFIFMIVIIFLSGLLMFTQKIQTGNTSVSFMRFMTTNDYILAFFTLGAFLVGISAIYIQKKRPTEFLLFITGNIGQLSVAGSLSVLISEISYSSKTKYTAYYIKKVVKMDMTIFYFTLALFAVALFASWIMGQKVLKRNYWYYFILFAPYIVISSFFYRKYIDFTDFFSSKQTTYNNLAKMFKTYNENHYSNINMTLMDEFVHVSATVAWTGLILILIIGGIWSVFKIEKSTKEKIKKQKTN